MEIKIIQGDITRQSVDVIVNAANCSLLGGGGVDGAIHRAAGPGLVEECRKFGGCRTGEAVITGAYNLPCKYVIHTPGPVWSSGKNNEEQLLKNCYLNSLRLAAEKKLPIIACPCISTGVYGFPAQRAAEIAFETVRDWQEEFPKTTIFVTFGDKSDNLYRTLARSLNQ